MPVDLQTPVAESMLDSLDSRKAEVVIRGKLSDDEYRLLAARLNAWPAVDLLVIQGLAGASFSNLEFLRFFPRLRRFGVAPYAIEDMSGLRYLPSDLDALTLSGSYPGRFSLTSIAHLSGLRELGIEGPRNTDLDVIGRLSNLEKLALRSFTLGDLSIFLPLERLWFFALRLGGTRNLALLPQIGKLKYLEIWRVSNLSDLRVIGTVHSLQLVFLQHLSKLTELPCLASVPSLRHITLDGVRPVSDLSPLCEAPSLESIYIAHMPQLEPDDVRCLAGVSSLKQASVGLSRRRKCEEAAALVRLPPAPWYHAGDGFQFN
jgi:hypothetical protein